MSFRCDSIFRVGMDMSVCLSTTLFESDNEQDYILRGVHDTHNISLQLVILFL